MDCICLAIMRSLSNQENQIINQQTDDTIHLNVKKKLKLTSPILDNIYNFQQSWESQFHSISTNNQISANQHIILYYNTNTCKHKSAVTSPRAWYSTGICDSGYTFCRYHLKLLHCSFSLRAFLSDTSPQLVLLTPTEETRKYV